MASLAPRQRASRAGQGILWRVPPTYQRRVHSEAEGQSVSQNAYITATSVAGGLALSGVLDRARGLGPLVAEMDDAAQRDDVVIGSCANSEWSSLKPFLDTLVDADLIPSVKTRDLEASNSLSYAFRFTRDGRDVWPALGRLVAAFLRPDKDRKSG